eukprot:TRINITY_DN17765_c0_g1_i1.p1 TRINITY_DN17765_c0_g1~~TRINITY_DN17765_c0_g1_i1.p1  ORF type:complete len:268 (+),score=26.36 TRINITY_DN17765_c0_g1_i1:105-908(+)
MFAKIRDLLLLLDIRLRRKWQLEVARIFVQLYLVWSLGVIWVSLFFFPLAWELPWNLPFRMYRDTFGSSITTLFGATPPLMDRHRYEQPGNMWRLVTFSADQFLGALQDHGFALWNWGARGMWYGPLILRIKVIIACLVIYVPLYGWISAIFIVVFHRVSKDPFWRRCYSRVFRAWVLCLPEWMLILEQVYSAKAQGRVFSASILENLDEFERPSRRKDAEVSEAVELSGEPEVIGAQKELEETVSVPYGAGGPVNRPVSGLARETP